MAENNIFDEFFGGGPSGFGEQFKPQPKKEEKAPPWQAKVIDGVYYVPLSQVADLLEMNKTLPKVKKGIDIRVQAQKERKEMGID